MEKTGKTGLCIFVKKEKESAKKEEKQGCKMLYFSIRLHIIVHYRCVSFLSEKGWMEMVKTIRMTQDDVQRFVDVASKCDFDIDISYNRYVVDAKSFLGVYGLDFRKPLTVSYDGYNAGLEELLKKYAIAC